MSPVEAQRRLNLAIDGVNAACSSGKGQLEAIKHMLVVWTELKAYLEPNQ